MILKSHGLQTVPTDAANKVRTSKQGVFNQIKSGYKKFTSLQENAFNDIIEIIPGATTKALCRKHLMRSRPKADNCFTIKGKTRDLDLEFGTKAERDHWISMLSSCIEFRNHKGLD